MVWRDFCDMGDLPPVFSSPVAGRICICTPDRERISALAAGQSASRISGNHLVLARRRLVFLELAGSPQPFLETGTGGGTDPGNRGIIIYQCRPAVSSSFQHR